MQRKAGLVHKLQVARRAMIDGVVGVHRKPGHRVQGLRGYRALGMGSHRGISGDCRRLRGSSKSVIHVVISPQVPRSRH